MKLTAIRLDRLAKRYGSIVALKNVSLDVAPGEIFGFLGLNGAGKTTTIRILLDLTHRTAGQASVFGMDCHAESVKVRARIGYLPGELGFYGDMTGAATLSLLGRLSAIAIDRDRRRGLLDRFELSRRDLARHVREYSTGMKRKLGIVQAFQSDAPLLILDEPTEGLDPLMQETFYDLLADTRRSGRTVFMSSHVLSEVERVCDRIGVIRQGELVLVSTVEEVRRLGARTVRIRFTEPVAAPAGGWPDGCELLEAGPQAWTLRVRGALGPLLAFAARLPLSDMDVDEPHLEEILRQYYRHESGQ
jgi:ABC-2 type transport system ATP-binding protein